MRSQARIAAAERRLRHGRRRAEGFTTVELVIALSIVLIASLGGFASQHASRALLRTSEETLAAVSELENAMNLLLVETVGELADPDGEYPAGVPLAAFEDRVLADQTIVPFYPTLVVGEVPDLLEIRLEIRWQTFQGHPRVMTLRTCKAR